MRTVLLAPAAERDFEGIWDHTHAHWGVEQAETYVRQLWHHIDLLAEQPGLGQKCPEIRHGYHRYPSGSLYFLSVA